MSQLRFRKSPDPLRNFVWALQHAAIFGAFALVVFVLNQTDHMRMTSALGKAVLILGLLVNFMYFCGYIIIAGIKYAGRAYEARKN
jgi:hypothetical protein